MTLPLQPEGRRRPPRQKLAHPSPVVLRFASGIRVRGKLHVISITGGLIALSDLLGRGSRAKLMFLTEAGAVLGTAEMLIPISTTMQPFRFVEIGDGDQSRIQGTIHSAVERDRRDRESIVNDRA